MNERDDAWYERAAERAARREAKRVPLLAAMGVAKIESGPERKARLEESSARTAMLEKESDASFWERARALRDEVAALTDVSPLDVHVNRTHYLIKSYYCADFWHRTLIRVRAGKTPLPTKEETLLTSEAVQHMIEDGVAECSL